MLRPTIFAALLVFLAYGGLAPAVQAEEAKDRAAPEMATDEEVAEALAEFKAAYKAKGLKGDDRVMQRDHAMRMINKLHHPEVVKALGKASKSSDEDVRLIAVIYLGDQVLLPHLAAQHVLAVMKKSKKDIVALMTCLQSLGHLKYVGAAHNIRAMLKHKQFVVRKAAISAVGDVGDTRMLGDVLKVLGVKLEGEASKDTDKKESKKETTSEGASWEGAEAVVDRGEADNSKENADAKKQAEAQIAKNKAAAMAASGGGRGAGGVGGMGGSGGRGGTARSTEEMIPTILRTLKKLTGEEFKRPSQIRTWAKEQKDWIDSEKKRLDKLEKRQRSAK
ncbi:MAG: hypothetical protein P1V36_10030 [Planctomycetota bacterium]|nr:hypothetical protein [Planctomycetota bacterium]